MPARGFTRRHGAREVGWAVALLLAVAVGAVATRASSEAGDPAPTSESAPNTEASGAVPEGAAPAKQAEASTEAVDELARIAKRSFDLERALGSTRLDLAAANRRFEAAQQRLDAVADADEGQREEVAARRFQLESAQRKLSLLEQRLERLSLAEEVIRRQRQIAEQSVSPEDLTAWLEATADAHSQLEREASVKHERLDELRRDRTFTAEQMESLAAGDPARRWAGLRLQTLKDLERAFAEDLAEIEDLSERTQRLETRIVAAQEGLPLSTRLRGALHYLRTAWNYPLTGADAEPITMGKVVSALVIFVLGWAIARLVARILGKRVFARMKMEAGAADAFELLAFYLLLFVAFLTALRMVQIPLTAFAVVGGALAIGVGFGSQNVVNNFISGIILLVERPIKRGDLVELQGVFGNIERIGLRSTRVRTGDNIHIIVPNASFLESNVVNWTHADPKVRINITVGVAYGSPTRDVERLILQAVEEQEGTLPDPEPTVLFTDFGDNALAFEARFWIVMPTMMARLKMESDIRYRIDDLFREAGISIAFPQRDVHLDTISPVEVRLVDETGRRPQSGEGSSDA